VELPETLPPATPFPDTLAPGTLLPGTAPSDNSLAEAPFSAHCGKIFKIDKAKNPRKVLLNKDDGKSLRRNIEGSASTVRFRPAQ
jgi:hypothetical protein